MQSPAASDRPFDRILASILTLALISSCTTGSDLPTRLNQEDGEICESVAVNGSGTFRSPDGRHRFDVRFYPWDRKFEIEEDGHVTFSATSTAESCSAVYLGDVETVQLGLLRGVDIDVDENRLSFEDEHGARVAWVIDSWTCREDADWTWMGGLDDCWLGNDSKFHATNRLVRDIPDFYDANIADNLACPGNPKIEVVLTAAGDTTMPMKLVIDRSCSDIWGDSHPADVSCEGGRVEGSACVAYATRDFAPKLTLSSNCIGQGVEWGGTRITIENLCIDGECDDLCQSYDLDVKVY